MGIQGLLPLLKDIQTPIHISTYSGQTLGIDAYVWLHRGAYGCAREIVLGDPTPRYIAHALSRIRMLQHFGVKPYLVFDGDKLPAKRGTEDDREQRRSENLAKARALEQEGKGREAREVYAKCVDVTPEMAYQLIKELRKDKIEYVVAPYEADAQLAYLEAEGLIDGVVTEDSDLLVFGCKTVLFKLDQAGNAIEMRQQRFWSNRQLALSGWTAVEFRQMAILSGCDYLPSIVGMGLKNAHRLLRRYKTVDKVLQAVRLEGKMRVPPTYAREFRKAELTFVHQRVFDPRSKKLVTLTPLPDGTHDDMLPFIGAGMDDETAKGVAEGIIDPISRTPIVDRVPKPLGVRSNSASNIEAGSIAAQQHTLQRSTTAPIAGGSSFYRSSVGQSSAGFGARKKIVSKETGLQSLKNFFGGTSTGKSSSGQTKPKAEPSKAKEERVPLAPRDTNRGSNPLLSPSSEQDSKPTQSKFFARQSGRTLQAASSSSPPPADHAYLHLGGELTPPSKPRPEANDSGYWDDECADMRDFVKSSSPAASAPKSQCVVMDTQELWQGTLEEVDVASPAVVSSSTTTTASVVVVPQTPSRGTKRTRMHSGWTESSSPESGIGSGFISSPASSSVRGAGGLAGEEDEEEEDQQRPSASPSRTIKRVGQHEREGEGEEDQVQVEPATPIARARGNVLHTSSAKLEAFRYLGSSDGCRMNLTPSASSTTPRPPPNKMLKRSPPKLVLTERDHAEKSYDTTSPVKAKGLLDRFRFNPTAASPQQSTRSRQLPF